MDAAGSVGVSKHQKITPKPICEKFLVQPSAPCARKIARAKKSIRRYLLHNREFKLGVVECAYKIGIKEAARKYGLPTSQVLYWRKQKERLKDSIRKKGEGSKHIAADMGLEGFSSSERWVKSFKWRHGIKCDKKQSSEEENDSRKRKLRNHTNAFKLTLVACAEKIGNRATGRKYGVAEKQLRYWRKQKDELARHLENKRLPGGGRHAHWPELEKRLFEWTRKHEAARKTVTFEGLKCEAMHLAQELDLVNFKCSDMWLRRFRMRYSVNCRRMQTAGNDLKLTTIESAGQSAKLIQRTRQAEDVPEESEGQQENEDGVMENLGPSTHEICEFFVYNISATLCSVITYQSVNDRKFIKVFEF